MKKVAKRNAGCADSFKMYNKKYIYFPHQICSDMKAAEFAKKYWPGLAMMVIVVVLGRSFLVKFSSCKKSSFFPPRVPRSCSPPHYHTAQHIHILSRVANCFDFEKSPHKGLKSAIFGGNFFS